MSVNIGTAVAYLTLETSKFNQGLNAAQKGFDTFSGKTEMTNTKLGKVTQTMTSVGTTMTKRVTAPIVGLGTAAVKTAADFESKMSKVSAISGATGGDLTMLKNRAKEMGATTKFSAVESAEAMTYMGMAGWEAQEIYDGLPGIMNLAAAAGEDLATTSDIVTDALTGFGLKASDSAHFADILAQASRKSNTNVAMMGQTFKYVAPVCGAMGYSAEDTAVAVGLMANAGIKSSQAGTSLRGALLAMVKPSDTAATRMEELGISLTNSDGSMKSLGEVMDMLRDRFSGLTEAEQANAAATIFGREASSGMLAIINASQEDYEDLTKDIYDCDEVAEEMAKTMQDNLAGQLVLLQSAIEGIAVGFGEIMLPVLTKVVKFLQKIASGITEIPKPLKRVILVLGTIAAAIGPILVGGAKLIKLAASVKTALEAFPAALKLVNKSMQAFSSGAKVFGTVLKFAFTTPLGIVLTLVAAFVAALIFDVGGLRTKLVEIFKDLWAKVKEIWGHIKDFFTESIPEFFKKIWGHIKDFFESVSNHIETFVKGLWDKIKDVIKFFVDLFGSILEIFNTAKTVLSEVWSFLWNNFGDIAKAAWEKIKEFVKLGIEAVKGVIETVMEAIKAAFEFVWGKIKDFFKSVWEDIKSVVKWYIETVKEVIKAGWNTVKQVFIELWNIIKEVFKEAWEAIKGIVTSGIDKVKGAIQKGVDFIKKHFGDGFNALLNIAKTVWNGIKSVVTTGINAVKSVISTILKAIKTLWNNGWSGLVDIVKNIWSSIKKRCSNALESVGETIKNFGPTLKNKAANAFSKIQDGFSNTWKDIKKWAFNKVQDLADSLGIDVADFKTAGWNILMAMWNGMIAVWNQISGWFSKIGGWIAEKVRSIVDTVNRIKNSFSNIGGTGYSSYGGRTYNAVGSYATGLSYVPYDGFPAILHKGERVLTREEAVAYNAGASTGSGNGGYVFNFYNPQALTPAEQARQFKKTMNQILLNM